MSHAKWLVTSLFLWASLGHAELPEGFTPVRPAGMGGAYTGVAADESSIWTNPAGISRTRKARARSRFHITKLPNVIAGFNKTGKSFYSSLSSANSDDAESVAESASEVAGDPIYARLAAFPVTTFDVGRNNPMAFGVFSNAITKAAVDSDTPTDTKVSVINDLGTVIGMAFATASNRASIGFTLRPTYRYAYEDTVPTTEVIDPTAMQTRFQENANSGLGVGADFGALFTLADFWFPTVGFAIRNLPIGCKSDYLNPYSEQRENVCGTVYSGSDGNPDALSALDPTDVRAGVSIAPRLHRELGLRFAADLHNILLTSGTTNYGLPGLDLYKMLHAGLELYTGNPLEQNPFILRIGTSQGFISLGATIHMGVLALDFASYGVDISDSATRREDRRYLGALTLLF